MTAIIISAFVIVVLQLGYSPLCYQYFYKVHNNAFDLEIFMPQVGDEEIREDCFARRVFAGFLTSLIDLQLEKEFPLVYKFFRVLAGSPYESKRVRGDMAGFVTYFYDWSLPESDLRPSLLFDVWFNNLARTHQRGLDFRVLYPRDLPLTGRGCVAVRIVYRVETSSWSVVLSEKSDLRELEKLLETNCDDRIF